MCRRPSWLVSKVKAKGKFTYILQIPRCIETRQSFIHFLNVNKRSGAEEMKLKVIGQTKDYAIQVSIRRSLMSLPI